MSRAKTWSTLEGVHRDGNSRPRIIQLDNHERPVILTDGESTMPERSGDWIRQAARDLESARSQKKVGFHEWACFIAQQAAEKALYQHLGAEAWGHSLLELLRGLEEKVPLPPELREQALLLDKLYVPTRYLNGWAEGIPADYITEGDATDAISSAQEIVRFSEGRLARP